jgi:SpoVK/Ycf46/Vps4 family AAA+-type ATPase
VTFDEVEDVLCDGSYSMWGFRSNAKFSKSMINTILETNKTPAIWITNTVDGIDPAYLRRFDFVINLKTPVAGTKKRMALRTFGDLPMQKGVVDRLVSHDAITAAHMKKVTKICERVGATTAKEVSHITDKVLNGDLKAVSERPLKIRPSLVAKRRVELPYRPDLINCDTDIEHLSKNLRSYSSARICAFGPPGTGKTAWAKHLAKKVRRPLLIKRASDILDKYVGGTEKNIAAVFREATSTRSILMLDEMDSFLPDRANATRQWEVTQANQFLTAMEEYNGILICSTNLLGNLDPATMRRFDFKIHFNYLTEEQALEIGIDLMKTLRVKLTRESKDELLARLSDVKLSHGDFAVLLRRYRALKAKPDVQQLIKDLKWEASFRDQDSLRPIGFLADVL